MNKIKARLLAWIFVFAVVSSSSASPVLSDASQSGENMRQILIDLEKEMRQIGSMQTKFSQKKKLSLFQHEVHLQGTLSMEKPDRFAWHTESPIRYSVIFKKNKIYQWDEDTDHVQILSSSGAPVLKMVIEQMQTWFYGSYVALLDQYEIRVLSQEPLELQFIPHAEVLSAAVIKSITIRFQPDQSYIASLRVEEKNGDQSLLSFAETILNAQIDPSVWKVKNRA